MAQFHVPEDLLADYALGNLAEATALLVATHLTLCPECRETVARYEAVGGVLLDAPETAAVPPSEIEVAEFLSRLDEPRLPGEGSAPVPAKLDGVLPRTLAPYVPDGVDGARWRSIVPGIREIPLIKSAGPSAALMRMRPGRGPAKHTHGGLEFTLVLAGGFTDRGQSYARGDVAVADGSVQHNPVADPGEDCICLIVKDAPLRFTGPLGPVLQFLAR